MTKFDLKNPMSMSVLIPAYFKDEGMRSTQRGEQSDFHRGKCFEKTLWGFYHQTLAKEQWELIVIDNNTPDKDYFPRLCDKFQDKMNIRYLRYEGVREEGTCFNIAHPLNLGLKHASGRIICRSLTETYFYEDALERMLAPHKTGGDKVYYRGYVGAMIESFPQFISMDLEKDNKQVEKLPLHCFENKRLERGQPITGGTSVSRGAIEEIGGFDEEYLYWNMLDVDFEYRLNKIGIFLVDGVEELPVGFHQDHSRENSNREKLMTALEHDKKVLLKNIGVKWI